MVRIEHDNPSLKGVLPKDYARPALDKQRLGELIDLIGTIALGAKEHQSKDLLGRVCQNFLSQFACAKDQESGRVGQGPSPQPLSPRNRRPRGQREVSFLDPRVGSWP